MHVPEKLAAEPLAQRDGAFHVVSNSPHQVSSYPFCITNQSCPTDHTTEEYFLTDTPADTKDCPMDPTTEEHFLTDTPVDSSIHDLKQLIVPSSSIHDLKPLAVPIVDSNMVAEPGCRSQMAPGSRSPSRKETADVKHGSEHEDSISDREFKQMVVRSLKDIQASSLNAFYIGDSEDEHAEAVELNALNKPTRDRHAPRGGWHDQDDGWREPEDRRGHESAGSQKAHDEQWADYVPDWHAYHQDEEERHWHESVGWHEIQDERWAEHAHEQWGNQNEGDEAEPQEQYDDQWAGEVAWQGDEQWSDNQADPER